MGQLSKRDDVKAALCDRRTFKVMEYSVSAVSEVRLPLAPCDY